MEDKVSHQSAAQRGIPKSVWEDNASQLISYAIPRRILLSKQQHKHDMSIQKKEYLYCVLKLLQLGVL